MSKLTDIFCSDWSIRVTQAEQHEMLRWWSTIVTTPNGVDLVGARPPGFRTQEDYVTWSTSAGKVAEVADLPEAPDIEFGIHMPVLSVIGVGAHTALTYGTECGCCHAWRVLAVVVVMSLLLAILPLSVLLGQEAQHTVSAVATLVFIALLLAATFGSCYIIGRAALAEPDLDILM